MALGRLSIAAEPAHHWRWSLLRVRPERPDRHAAEHRDELAPLQLIEPLQHPTSQGRIAEYRIGADQSGYRGTIYNGRGVLAVLSRQLNLEWAAWATLLVGDSSGH
jgi:hypothetical protein